MNKINVQMKKLVYLDLSALDIISKIAMYEYWYDYAKPNYGDNPKLCHMDTDSIRVHVKAEDVYKDILRYVEQRFDTSNYEVKRPLPIEKTKT